jgi:hypothetical protein
MQVGITSVFKYYYKIYGANLPELQGRFQALSRRPCILRPNEDSRPDILRSMPGTAPLYVAE